MGSLLQLHGLNVHSRCSVARSATYPQRLQQSVAATVAPVMIGYQQPNESPANIAIDDISLKTRFFGLHVRCRKYWCIFNHLRAIRPESYRIRWNYAPAKGITPFKVIQGHRVWYQSKAHMCDFLYGTLATILHRFRDRSKIAIFGYPSCV